jgi:hypothetical protein
MKGYCYDANWINLVKGWVEWHAFVINNESVNQNIRKLISGSAIKLEIHKIVHVSSSFFSRSACVIFSVETP